MAKKQTICLDFDGTIHSYERGWHDGTIYGTVTPGFFAWLEAVAPVYDVQVFSTRSATQAGIESMRAWLTRHYDAWAEQDDARPRTMPVGFATSKPRAVISIDDRAITFRGSWSDLYPDDLAAFRPWNKPPTQENAAVVDDINPAHVMHTVTDEPGRRMLEKLFKTYVQDEQLHPRLPAFLLAADRLLQAHGGRPREENLLADLPEEDDEEDAGGDDEGADDYDDDEDLHAENASADADAERIRASVFRMMRGDQ